MHARPGSNPCMGGMSCPVRLMLICLMLAVGKGFSQAGLPTHEDKTVRVSVAVVSKVEFEPPYTWTLPRTSLARIHVANRASGDLVPEAAPYVLAIPAGLQVYRDSARTMPIPAGQTLMTEATGYDTLWAASAPDIATDHTFTLDIMGSTRTLRLTFVASTSSFHARLQKAENPSSLAPFHDALGRKFSPGAPHSGMRGPSVLGLGVNEEAKSLPEHR